MTDLLHTPPQPIAPHPTRSQLRCVGDGALHAIEDPAYADSVSQRDAELLPLYIAVDRASNGAEAEQASAGLQQALGARTFVDQAVRHAVSTLLSLPQVTNLLQVSMHVQAPLHTGFMQPLLTFTRQPG